MVLRKVHGRGSSSSLRLLAYIKEDQEWRKRSAQLTFSFVVSTLGAQAMAWFCSDSETILIPQLLLFGKAFTDVTKPKGPLANTLGISKSNQVTVLWSSFPFLSVSRRPGLACIFQDSYSSSNGTGMPSCLRLPAPLAA